MPSTKTIEAKIEGLKPILARMERWKGGKQRKVIRAAISKASTVILQEVKSRVPKRSGLLKKSMGRKVKTYTRTGTVIAIVGPRVGHRKLYKGNYIDPVKYAHLVEFGRKASVVRKKKVMSDGSVIYGKKTKPVAPKPFIRQSWAARKHDVRKIIIDELNRGIKRELAKQ